MLLSSQLLDAAEAKAYYGLAKNYAALEALVEALIQQETLSGEELAAVLEKVGPLTTDRFNETDQVKQFAE